MTANPPELYMPSHSTEAEKTVLGRILSKPDSINLIGTLQAKHFFKPENRIIFNAMLDVQLKGLEIDIICVAERLEEFGEVNNPLIVLEELARSDSSAESNFPKYCQIVVERYHERMSILAARKYTQDKIQGDENAFGNLITSFDNEETKHEVDLKTSIASVVDHTDKLFRGEVAAGIPSGIEKFDETFGGFHNSDFIVVGARPSIGKTAFACNIALNCGVPVGFISAEQPADQITQRYLSILGQIDTGKFRTGKFEDQDWPKLTDAVVKLQKKEFYTYDKSNPHVMEVVQIAAQWKYRHNIGMLIIDYLQFLEGDGESRVQVVSNISKTLKGLAKRLNIPVICLAQLSRECEKRQDKRPILSDLKESGSIEQDADNVIFLYRDSVYNKDSEDNNMEVNMVKNRHGRIGKSTAGWIPKYITLTPKFEKNGS